MTKSNPKKIKLSQSKRQRLEKSRDDLKQIYFKKPHCREAELAYQHLSIFLNQTS